MKTSVDKLDGLARKLTIEIPQNRVDEAFDEVYKGIQKSATIKGFRKGKAPLDALRKLYADRVKQDVLERLVSEGYQSALSEHEMVPVSQPNIQFDQIEESQAFSFTMEFEVRPEVELKTYEGLKVEKEKLDFSEDQIDETLENIRKSRQDEVPVFEDRAAQDGDVAELDFEGTIAGSPLEGGSAAGHKIELGTNTFIPGFEEGVVGMKINEVKDIHLEFPKDYHAADIAGKPVSFKVTLKALLKKVMPELNDEFAKKLGDYETLDALRDAIRKDMEEGEKQRVEEELNSRILKALVKANPVEVPKELHKSQKNALVQDVAQRMKQQGMSEKDFQEYNDKWGEDFDETASFMIQSNLLVDELAAKLQLSATQKEVDEKLKDHAARTGIEVAKLKEYYTQEGRLSNLRYKITEEKVVDLLKSKADIKEVSKDKLKES